MADEERGARDAGTNGDSESVPTDGGAAGDAAGDTAGDAAQGVRQTAGPNTAKSASATRDHLANERTLLAWARTGIAVIGLGFVVARFGLLIRDLGGHPARGLPEGTSTAFGTLLVLVGSALLLLALLRYLRSGRQIDEGVYRWSPLLGTLLAGTLLVAGVLLAIYLLITG